MITIGQVTFEGAAEVWDTFTACQPVEEFLAYGQPGQTAAAQVAAYVAEISHATAPAEAWREFLAGVNREYVRDGSGRQPWEYPDAPEDEQITSAEAARIVCAAMIAYAEQHA